MNLQDYDPTRVCEALAWLYGGEWRKADGPGGQPGHAYWYEEGRWAILNPAGEMRFGAADHDITDRIAHALEVTAPWEWTRHRTGHWTCDTTEASAGLYEGTTPVPWWWNIGTMRHEDVAPDVESAQTAARAAYLTWMRGRLAMGEVTP